MQFRILCEWMGSVIPCLLATKPNEKTIISEEINYLSSLDNPALHTVGTGFWVLAKYSWNFEEIQGFLLSKL